MTEYMLLIYNVIDHQADWPAERHEQFLKKCESYINNLKKEGKLIAAQPLARQGKIISGSKGNWQETPLKNYGEIQVGYYHILAKDMNMAIAIAKENPEFEFGKTARIEIRPIQAVEKDTKFVYPK